MDFGIDWSEVVRRALKYLFEGLAISIACYYIPARKIKLEEIIMIAITAAATFAVLDMYIPSAGGAARWGVGATVGAGLAGGVPTTGAYM